jgi:hypothetical protein
VHEMNGKEPSEKCGHTPLTHVANKCSKGGEEPMTIEEDIGRQKDPQTFEASCKHRMRPDHAQPGKDQVGYHRGKSRNDAGRSPYL